MASTCSSIIPSALEGSRASRSSGEAFTLDPSRAPGHGSANRSRPSSTSSIIQGATQMSGLMEPCASYPYLARTLRSLP